MALTDIHGNIHKSMRITLSGYRKGKVEVEEGEGYGARVEGLGGSEGRGEGDGVEGEGAMQGRRGDILQWYG